MFSKLSRRQQQLRLGGYWYVRISPVGRRRKQQLVRRDFAFMWNQYIKWAGRECKVGFLYFIRKGFIVLFVRHSIKAKALL